MKKILKLSLIVLLILSLAFVVTGCGEKEENNTATNSTEEKKEDTKSKTYSVLSKVFSGDSYIMTFEGEMDFGEGVEKATMTMAVKGDNIYTDVNSTSQHATVMFKDNTTYVISHDDKMYMTTQGKDENTIGDETQLLSKDELAKLEKEEYTTGKETIDGTEYEYEEYKDVENNMSARYYFNGNDLIYMKSVGADGKEELMKVTKLSSEVSDDLFTVPTDYELVNASNL